MSERRSRPTAGPGEATEDPTVPITGESTGVAERSSGDPADAASVAQTRAVAVRIQAAEHFEFSGPLPHPELFRGYEDTLPGAADRILTLAEREQNRRHLREDRGQWMAFLIALLLWAEWRSCTSTSRWKA